MSGFDFFQPAHGRHGVIVASITRQIAGQKYLRFEFGARTEKQDALDKIFELADVPGP